MLVVAMIGPYYHMATLLVVLVGIYGLRAHGELMITAILFKISSRSSRTTILSMCGKEQPKKIL